MCIRDRADHLKPIKLPQPPKPKKIRLRPTLKKTPPRPKLPQEISPDPTLHQIDERYISGLVRERTPLETPGYRFGYDTPSPKPPPAVPRRIEADVSKDRRTDIYGTSDTYTTPSPPQLSIPGLGEHSLPFYAEPSPEEQKVLGESFFFGESITPDSVTPPLTPRTTSPALGGSPIESFAEPSPEDEEVFDLSLIHI